MVYKHNIEGCENILPKSDIGLKIPKGQEIMVRSYDEKHILKYVVTRTLLRDTYFLYKADKDNKLTKVKQSKKPMFKEVSA